MTSWFVYWIILFGKLQGFFKAMAAISGIFLGIILFLFGTIGYIEEEDGIKKAFRKATKFAWVPVVCVFLSLITPDLKEIAAIYLLPKIANNEQVQEIPGKALNLLELKLDEWVKDITEKEVK